MDEHELKPAALGETGNIGKISESLFNEIHVVGSSQKCIYMAVAAGYVWRRRR
jgi:hypothetical protein